MIRRRKPIMKVRLNGWIPTPDMDVKVGRYPEPGEPVLILVQVNPEERTDMAVTKYDAKTKKWDGIEKWLEHDDYSVPLWHCLPEVPDFELVE
ncbi:MAG: hypothetical protein PHQ75_00485 [Thermoguttaceae bacterium]|nr:hypothetical protein [Thermoguttaceae bacterium]